jgi:hypothetical protein
VIWQRNCWANSDSLMRACNFYVQWEKETRRYASRWLILIELLYQINIYIYIYIYIYILAIGPEEDCYNIPVYLLVSSASDLKP